MRYNKLTCGRLRAARTFRGGPRRSRAKNAPCKRVRFFMVFSSMVFLFLFLTATLAVSSLVPARRRRARNLCCSQQASSFFFSESRLAFSSCWPPSRATISRRAAWPPDGMKKAWLAAAVVYNLALLGTFKYADFFVANVNALTGLSLPPAGACHAHRHLVFHLPGLELRPGRLPPPRSGAARPCKRRDVYRHVPAARRGPHRAL